MPRAPRPAPGLGPSGPSAQGAGGRQQPRLAAPAERHEPQAAAGVHGEVIVVEAARRSAGATGARGRSACSRPVWRSVPPAGSVPRRRSLPQHTASARDERAHTVESARGAGTRSRRARVLARWSSTSWKMSAAAARCAARPAPSCRLIDGNSLSARDFETRSVLRQIIAWRSRLDSCTAPELGRAPFQFVGAAEHRGRNASRKTDATE